jgi:hypothetical protein
MRAIAVVVLALSCALAPPLAAQDFAPAAGAGPAPGACAMLERALPSEAPALGAEALQTEFALVPGLRTRAVAAQFAWRVARVAAGLSQTGEPEWGWTCAALAVGSATRVSGAALRVAVTTDRANGPAFSALGSGAGVASASLAIGGGAWIAPGAGVRLWAQAPQCATRGAPPPQVRPLELGASLARSGARAWLAIEAPGRGGDGERALGVALARGPCELWGEGRDGPWRAALGVTARVRAITCAARVDAHPWLGTRTTLVLGLHGRERAGASNEAPR